MLTRLSLVLSSLIVSIPAGAQDGAPLDTLPQFQMDPVVVTGTRVEVARSNVPLTVSTIDGDAIRQSGETNVLPLLSRRVPGVFVTERGMVGYGIAGGAAGRITIRGVGGSPGAGTPNTNVLVMVDGHPQFMGIFGHPFPDAYVASDADRVEVIRGPASILYGTAAMGGVINIITSRVPEGGVHAGLSAAYGSHATQHYSGNAGIRRGGHEAFVSVNHDRTDGHRATDDAFDLTNAYLKLGTALSPIWRVTADGRVTQFHTEDPGPSPAPAEFTAFEADVLRGRVGLALENRGDRVQGAVKAYYNFGDHEITDGFESTDFTGGLVAYQAYRASRSLIVTLGADWKRYGGSARNVMFGADLGDHGISEGGGYAFLQHMPGTRMMLSGGVRVEVNSVFGAEVVPQLGAAYHLLPGTTVKASVAKGFRSPTVLELYLFAPANPDLTPERLWNYEIGLAHDFGRLHAEVVAFLSDGMNLIEVRPAGPERFQRRNVGEFTNKGIELQASAAVARGLRISGNLSYLDTSTRIIAAPEWLGFVEAAYARGPFSAGLEVELVNGLTTGSEGSGPAQTFFEEDYTLVHARAAYRPMDAVEVFVRGENLLDTDYEVNAFYPMPGATFMTGIRLRY